MKLQITKRAANFLRDLDAKQYKQVAGKLFELLTNPQPHDSSALKGTEAGERRADVGEFRIIYAIDSDIVSILVIGRRNDDDVYKIWQRTK
jgi:mRNA interferase RelE/StbE